jgi:transcriptional regulator with XRE-family HTH domain
MIKKNTQTVGDRIKIAREKSGLSQSEVSRIMCLSRTVCGQWERGFANPSTSQLVKIAQILRVSFEYLATGEVEKNNKTINNSNIDNKDKEVILTAKMLELFKKIPIDKKQKLVDFLE